MYMILRHIPNLLTLLRLVLIAPFLYFLLKSNYNLAFYIFFLAGFTDALDGWLARQCDWQTPFGSFVDPLADKLLVLTSFVSMAWIGELPWWLVVLVSMRDFTLVSAIFAWYQWAPVPMEYHPTKISKLNTLFQITLVIACLFQLAFQALPFPIIRTLIILTSMTTLISYIHYVWVWGRRAYILTHAPQ